MIIWISIVNIFAISFYSKNQWYTYRMKFCCLVLTFHLSYVILFPPPVFTGMHLMAVMASFMRKYKMVFLNIHSWDFEFWLLGPVEENKHCVNMDKANLFKGSYECKCKFSHLFKKFYWIKNEVTNWCLLQSEGLKVKPVNSCSPYSHLFLCLFLVLLSHFYLKYRSELSNGVWTDCCTLAEFHWPFCAQNAAFTEETSGVGFQSQPLFSYSNHTVRELSECVEIVTDSTEIILFLH